MLNAIECWICRRLKEPSTWNGIGVAVTAAALLPFPFNWIVGSVGSIGVIMGDRKHVIESKLSVGESSEPVAHSHWGIHGDGADLLRVAREIHSRPRKPSRKPATKPRKPKGTK